MKYCMSLDESHIGGCNPNTHENIHDGDALDGVYSETGANRKLGQAAAANV